MGSLQLTFNYKVHLPSVVLIMKTIMCLAAFVAASSAFLAPPPPPPHYGRPGHPRPSPFGGAMDPTTLLLLNKNGGLGGTGSNSLLPLLLLGGGGGLGGGHGKGFNPLLFHCLEDARRSTRPVPRFLMLMPTLTSNAAMMLTAIVVMGTSVICAVHATKISAAKV